MFVSRVICPGMVRFGAPVETDAVSGAGRDRPVGPCGGRAAGEQERVAVGADIQRYVSDVGRLME